MGLKNILLLFIYAYLIHPPRPLLQHLLFLYSFLLNIITQTTQMHCWALSWFIELSFKWIWFLLNSIATFDWQMIIIFQCKTFEFEFQFFEFFRSTFPFFLLFFFSSLIHSLLIANAQLQITKWLISQNETILWITKLY